MDRYLADRDRPISMELLFSIANSLIQNEMPREGERYLEIVKRRTGDVELLEKALILQCKLAEKSGNIQKLHRYQKQLVSYFPRHPLGADIRFRWVKENSENPSAGLEMVVDAVGAARLYPQDSRSVDALLVVARHMEKNTLYDLAAVYYRRALLLGTLQSHDKPSEKVTQALLGQARVLIARGELAEAGNIPRSLHVGIRHLDLWNESGHLWAALAFMQGQSREGVRRWGQVCGAPADNILPYIFSRLSPDQMDRSVRVAVTPQMKTQPLNISPELMHQFIDGALDTFLREGDVESAGELIERIAQDADWKDRCPVESYRSRFIQHLVARKELDSIVKWVNRLSPDMMQIGDLPLDKWSDLFRSYKEKTAPVALNGENS
jgi:hypothetical protein